MRVVGASNTVEQKAIVKPLGGFGEWKRAIDVSWVFETFAAADVRIFCIFDRDYRSREETSEFETRLREKGLQCFVLDRKEVENYLLVVPAILRCVKAELAKRSKKAPSQLQSWIEASLADLCQASKSHVVGQLVGEARRYQKAKDASQSDSAIVSKVYDEFEAVWNTAGGPETMVPGKKVLNSLFHSIQKEYGVSISVHKICNELLTSEVPSDLKNVLSEAQLFLAGREFA
jgi:hypothetical protein